MYRTVIIDDEMLIREGLKKVITTKFSDLEIVGEAKNGIEGLALIRQLSPDIAFLDIRMPGIDGLELAEQVMKEKYSVKIVILTGYSDFNYAQKALKIGVSDFLLKPTKKLELIATIDKIKTVIDRERAIDREEAVHRAVMAEKYLQHFFNGEVIENEVREKDLENIGVKFELYRICLVEIERHSQENSLNEIQSLKRVCSSILEKYGRGTALQLDSFRLCMIVSCKKRNNEKEDIGVILEEIRSKSEALLNISFSIGVSREMNGINNANLGLEQAKSALQNKFYGTPYSVLYFEGQDLNLHLNDPFPEEAVKDILNHIKTLDSKKYKEALSNLFQNMIESRKSQSTIREVCLKIVMKAIETYEEIFDEKWSPGVEYRLLYKEVMECTYWEDLFQWVTNTVDNIIEQINFRQISRYNWTVREIIKYLEEHYHEDISLESVARNKFFMHPNYLGRLVKQETGKSFTYLVNKIRIEKAKELLRKGTYKTYEVADMVGFKDPKYFTKTFKKYEIICPEDYRERG